ncbi:hypothetical protein HOQ87_gp15 [Vibrio phage AS51]|uniref:Uncharacterized protein n=1 Tax=Vibrio phage AS51 TaxID=1434127 RepID=A0A067YIV2_9CAUD|nr:hypothetical protein HOQ87_gp15 [Vibrio phage AS51]AHC94059.1 hypothetical protein [Vibrio phage AS51]
MLIMSRLLVQPPHRIHRLVSLPSRPLIARGRAARITPLLWSWSTTTLVVVIERRSRPVIGHLPFCRRISSFLILGRLSGLSLCFTARELIALRSSVMPKLLIISVDDRRFTTPDFVRVCLHPSETALL